MDGDENLSKPKVDVDEALKTGEGEVKDPSVASGGVINTEGGAAIQGNVSVEGGDFIGRDQYTTIITEETLTDVRGIPNPYLGLRAFNYSDQDAFGGRDGAIREAVAKLTEPVTKLTLFFITGASGSGKSSFAQAGLLPALEAHYRERRKRISRAVFRPSSDPLAMLADALSLLGLPELTSQELAHFNPGEFNRFLGEYTPGDQVNLLVIDQFEEFFTQSAPGQREVIFGFLAGLTDHAQIRTHCIATIRSDFLDELFEYKELWDIAKWGMELRAMGHEELKEAIQQPVYAACKGEGNGKKHDERYCQKRFEPALLERLVGDASQDPSYLPLLQVTLQEIWNKGYLRLGEYSSLTDAIQQRAEIVYHYEDYQAGNANQERSQEDQAAIVEIFLDLVDVALDSEVRRDVRRRRRKDELIANSKQYQRLVDDLIDARLLSAATEACAEGRVETVDIIHESLINNWDRLKEAITEQRNALQQRARFEMQLAEWLENGSTDEYTLTGVRLAEARDLERQGDIALRGEIARNFLTRSVELVEAAQRRELEQARALAEAEHRRVQVARRFTVGLSIVLVLTLFAAGYALWQRARAIAEQKVSNSRELAAVSIALLDADPELSLHLAMRSIQTYTPQGEDALRRAVLAPPVALTLFGHSGAVYSVAYDHQGKRLVTASEDHTARIWDAVTGKQISVLAGHADSVKAAAFSPDGRLVVTASADHTARIWDAATGQELLVLAEHSGPVNDAGFSPDGQRVITASDDNTARVWDVMTGHEVYSLTHTAPVRAAAFGPSGTYIATGGFDKMVQIWDASTGELNLQLSNGSEAVNSLAFSSDGQYLMWDWLYSAYSWNLQSSSLKPEYQGSHTWYLTDIALSPDNQLTATASRDHTVRLWNKESGSELVVLRGHGDGVYGVAFDPGGDHLATASADQTVRIWDLAKWRQNVLVGHTGQVFGAVFSPDGHRVATTSEDGTIRIWDTTSGAELMKIVYPDLYATRISFSPDGEQLITASDDGTWRIWDADTGQQVYQSDYPGIVHNARFNHNGTRIIVTGRPHFAEIWDASTNPPRQLLSLEGHTVWVATGLFSPDGKLVVTASADNTARVWSADTGELVHVLLGHSELVTKAAFNSDGERIVTASVDGTARIWETMSGETLHVLRGHSDQLTDAAFSPNGQYVATSSADDTVRIWDAATGDEIIRLRGHTDNVTSVSFSEDGRYLLTASLDGTARIYPVLFENVIALAKSYLSPRDFTCAERVKYLHEKDPCPTPVPVATGEP